MNCIEVGDLATIVALGGMQPVMNRQGDLWSLTLEGASQVIQVNTRRGQARYFKNPETAIRLLRESGYTGYLKIEV